MGHPGEAPAGTNRRGVTADRLNLRDAVRGHRDVDDRVDATDLVKRYVLERRTVSRGLRFRQQPEDPPGQRGGHRGHLGIGQPAIDVDVMSVLMLRRGIDHEMGLGGFVNVPGWLGPGTFMRMTPGLGLRARGGDDAKMRRAHRGLQNRSGLDRDPFEPELARDPRELVERNESGVDKGRREHVARDAGHRLKIQYSAHGDEHTPDARRTPRTTWQAA